MKKAADDIYLLEFGKFLSYLLNSDSFKDYVLLIYNEWDEKKREHENYLAKVTPKIIKLKNSILKKYSELNDSNIERPKFVRGKYRFSFAYFNDVLKGKRQRSFSMYPQTYDDNTDVGILLNIINSKISEYEMPSATRKKRKFDQKFWVEFCKIMDNHNYKHRDYMNFRRVSPGASLAILLQTMQAINPEPKTYSTKEDFFHSHFDFEEFKQSVFTRDILKAVYEYNRHKSEFPGDKDMAMFKARRQMCEAHLLRVYEAIREKIGAHLSHQQLINRYKTRCMWYGYTRMQTLAKKEQGNIYKREHRLTVHLARYLFDNGVTALYRAKFGKHEVDLVDPSSKLPIFVEAKVYVNSAGTKKKLIDGISQIHAYLNNITSKYRIQEAYYVIFRLGGPLYDMPPKISFQRYIIVPTIIDLAESKISGSRQPKPIIISLKEIVSKVEKAKKQKHKKH